MSHTPGPWATDAYFADGPVPSGFHIRPKVKPGAPLPPSIGEMVRGRMPVEECAANARLAAAGPEILDHLQSALVQLEFLRLAIEGDDPRPELLVRVKDLIADTRAAIGKARAVR